MASIMAAIRCEIGGGMLDFGLATEAEIRGQLCQRLRNARLSQGFSQATLAEMAGVSTSTVKFIESQEQCTLENFVRVVSALGLVGEMQDLFVTKPKSIAMLEQAQRSLIKRAPRQKRTLVSA
jgi:DNA-binding XRE family transcriptional regulator